MIPGDRHSSVFWWIQHKMVTLEKQGLVSVHFVTQTATAVSSMRAQANDLMSSLDRDQPFCYASLCGLLVQVNLLIMTVSKRVGVGISVYVGWSTSTFRSPSPRPCPKPYVVL